VTYLEILHWLRDNDYQIVIYPSEMLGEGCCTMQKYHRTVDLIERETARPDADLLEIERNLFGDRRTTDLIESETAHSERQSYFIEIAPNIAGDMCAYIYTYPKPEKLTGDVSVALTKGESVLPPERLVPDQGDGYFFHPYWAIGMRGKRSS
jgi:hypothetical protein